MRIFVTGATGFLGSYVAQELIRSGHEVAALVRPGADTWRIAALLGRLHVVPGSLANTASFSAELADFRPDAVVHLAWQGVLGAARNDPEQAANIVQTVALVQLAAELGASTFVGAGSQAEYRPYSRAITEQDETRPTTLYGRAKLAAGKMAEQVCIERVVRFAWLRVFSTYGPKDAPQWLIPSTIASLKRGERVALTKGEQRWGFLHARDAAAAFRVAVENAGARDVYNLGADEAPRLRDTIETVRSIMGSTTELGFGDVPYRPDQVMVLQADVTKLRSLGWSPTVALADGLRETVAWHAQRD